MALRSLYRFLSAPFAHPPSASFFNRSASSSARSAASPPAALPLAAEVVVVAAPPSPLSPFGTLSPSASSSSLAAGGGGLAGGDVDSARGGLASGVVDGGGGGGRGGGKFGSRTSAVSKSSMNLQDTKRPNKLKILNILKRNVTSNPPPLRASRPAPGCGGLPLVYDARFGARKQHVLVHGGAERPAAGPAQHAH